MGQHFVSRSGAIFSRLGNKLYDEETHKSVHYKFNKLLPKVSNDETEFLKCVKKSQRKKHVEKQTFSKLNKLKLNDNCIVTTQNGLQWATVFEKHDDDGRLMFLVTVEDGNKKTQLLFGGEELEIFEESKARFLIVVTNCDFPAGAILMKYSNHIFTLPDHKYVTMGDDNFEIISKEEAQELSKYDMKERINIRDSVGTKCYWRGKGDRESLAIIGKNVEADDTRISLMETAPKERSIQFLNELVQQRFVVCSKTNLLLVNPQSVKSVSDETVDDSGTELCLRVGEHGVVPAQLRWRGIVDGTACIGCVLNQDTEYGMDGTINDHGLFKCDIKDRGILIPVANEVVQGCATNQAGHAEWRMKGPSIDPVCICCVRKIEYPRGGERRDRLIVEDGGRHRVEDVAFRGFINGVECAGVNKNDFCVVFDLSKFDLKAIMDSLLSIEIYNIQVYEEIFCAEWKQKIINPSTIRKIEKVIPHLKVVVMNDGAVRLQRWTAIVNDKICLGLGLSSCAEEVPSAELQMLSVGEWWDNDALCGDDNAVVIVRKKKTKCNGESHRKKINTMKDGDVCCLEELKKLTVNKKVNIGSMLIVMGVKPAKKCVWMGRMNEQEVVAVEDDVRGQRSKMLTDWFKIRCKVVFNLAFNVREGPNQSKISWPVSADIPRHPVYCSITSLNPSVVYWTGQMSPIDKVFVLHMNNEFSSVKIIGSVGSGGDEIFVCELDEDCRWGIADLDNSRIYGNIGGRHIFVENIEEIKKHCKCHNGQHCVPIQKIQDITEDRICCIEKNVKKSETMKNMEMCTTRGRNGICVWMGTINGAEVAVLNTVAGLQNEVKIKGFPLFKCGAEAAIVSYPSMKFDFLSYTHEAAFTFKEKTKFKIGNLVEISRNIYGRVKYSIDCNNEKYVCVDVSRTRLPGIPNIKDIFQIKLKKKTFRGCFVHVTLLRKADFSSSNRVQRVIETRKNKKFKVGDLVRHRNEEKLYEITGSIFMNGNNAYNCKTGIDRTVSKILFEVNVKKVDDDKLISNIKLYLNFILLPNMVNQFRKMPSRFQKDDIVEIRSCKLNQKYSGIVMLAGLIGDSVDVAIVNIINASDIGEYKLSNVQKKNIGVNDPNMNLFVIPINVLSYVETDKKHIHLQDYTIFDPEMVKSAHAQWTGEVEVFITAKTGKKFLIGLRWSGVVNNEPCIGCSMTDDVGAGTDGKFEDQQLFKCLPGRGVLLPLTEIQYYCYRDGHLQLGKNGIFIKDDVVCCVETADNEKIKICNRVRVNNKDKVVLGICSWSGRVNGRNVVAIEMDESLCGLYKDHFIKLKTLFNTTNGVLIESDLCHKELLKFTCGKFGFNVARGEFSEAKATDKVGIDHLLCINHRHGRTLVELKWRGEIDGQDCVGVVFDEELEYGSDGEFGGIRLFECEAGRGAVLAVDNKLRCCLSDGHQKLTRWGGCIREESMCCRKTSFIYNDMNAKCIVVKSSDFEIVNVVWEGEMNNGVKVVQFQDMMKREDKVYFAYVDIPRYMKYRGIQLCNPCTVNWNLSKTWIDSVYVLNVGGRLRGVKVLFSVDNEDAVVLVCKLDEDWQFGIQNLNKNKINGNTGGRHIFIDKLSKIKKHSKCHTGQHCAPIQKTKDININTICCIKKNIEKSQRMKDTHVDTPQGCGTCVWTGTINGAEVAVLNTVAGPHNQVKINDLYLFKCVDAAIVIPCKND